MSRPYTIFTVADSYDDDADPEITLGSLLMNMIILALIKNEKRLKKTVLGTLIQSEETTIMKKTFRGHIEFI